MNQKELVRFFEAAGVDYTKGKAAKLVESQLSRDRNVTIFAAAFDEQDDGGVRTFQTTSVESGNASNDVVAIVASKLGLDEDTVYDELGVDFDNADFGVEGIQPNVQKFLAAARVACDPMEYAKAERFLRRAEARCAALDSPNEYNPAALTVASIYREPEGGALVVITVSPNSRRQRASYGKM